MDGWENILRPDERILWQGKPDARIKWDFKQMPTAIFGLIFAGFALFWMTEAYEAGAFWMFGLIHFFAGLGIGLGPILMAPFLATRTWYSLSNQRAFIATNMPLAGKELYAVEITPTLGLDFDGDDPGNIRFRDTAKSLTGARQDSTPRFSELPDAPQVFRLIRDIQRGTV